MHTRAHTDACCGSKETEAPTAHTPGGEHRPLRPDADGVACEQEPFETFNAKAPIAQSLGLKVYNAYTRTPGAGAQSVRSRCVRMPRYLVHKDKL